MVGQYENEFNTEESPKEIDALAPDMYHYPEEDNRVEADETPEITDGSIMLDPTKWQYSDYAEFLTHTLRGDWEKAFPVIMKAAVGWSFPIPFGPDAYQEISFADLPRIAAAVDLTIQKFVDGLDTNRVKIHMRKWSMNDYFAYRTAAQKGDIPALEALFRKVAELPGLKAKGPMTFEQGVLISTALGKHVTGMFKKGK